MTKPTFVLLLYGIILAALPAYSEGWAGLSSKGPLPVRIEQAHKVFLQCSRHTPRPSGSLWLPSSSEIAALEQDLLTYMEALGETFFADPRWSIQAYRGQYVGFSENSEKYVYGSYIVENSADYFALGEPINICDGGPSAWGILYRIENGDFLDFAVNGR